MSGLVSRLSNSSTGSSGSGTLPPSVPSFSVGNASVKFVQSPSFEKINSSLTNTGISNLAVINGRVELYNTTGKAVPRAQLSRSLSQSYNSNHASSSKNQVGYSKGSKPVKQEVASQLSPKDTFDDVLPPPAAGSRSPGTPSFTEWQKVESPRHSSTSDSPSRRTSYKSNNTKDSEKANKTSKTTSAYTSINNKELFSIRPQSDMSRDGILPQSSNISNNSMDLVDTYTAPPPRIRACSVDDTSPRIYLMGGAKDLYSGPSSSSSGINAPGYSRERSTSMGDFSEQHAKKLLIDLQTVLNECFSDYDFKSTKVDQFKDCQLPAVVNTVNERLRSLTTTEDANFLVHMWEAINQEIHLQQCQIFTYLPDYSGDIFSEVGNLWSFNFFFFNPRFKKVCFFYCIASSNMSSGVDDSDLNDSGLSTYEEEDDGYSQSDISEKGDTYGSSYLT